MIAALKGTLNTRIIAENSELWNTHSALSNLSGGMFI